MKKLILSVTALAACSVGAYAQGTLVFDTSSSANHVTIGGVLDTTTDINAELLYSTSAAGTFTPVAEVLLSSSNTSPDGLPGFDNSDILSAAGDITFLKTGALQEQSGSAFFPSASAAAGATGFFEVEGWLGNYSSLAAAAAAGQATGTSASFSEVLTSSQSPSQATLGAFGGVNLQTAIMPEPSTLAMAGVGLASMLFFRRKNK
jgi:hypothetical protein